MRPATEVILVETITDLQSSLSGEKIEGGNLSNEEIINGLKAITFAFLAAAGTIMLGLGLVCVMLLRGGAEIGGMICLSGIIMLTVAYFVRKSGKETDPRAEVPL